MLGKLLLASSLSLSLTATATPTWADSAADLSSRTRDNIAPAAGTIKVGTAVKAVNAGDFLTDAEQVALQQVLASGTQSLLLNAFGTARGGTFSVNNLGANISGLVVPRGVTALQNVAQSNNLNITGNLTNSGSIFLYSSDPHTVAANIAAQNIFNNAGGLLSTSVPTSLLGGATAVAQLNLNLSAIQNIINAGIIRSSGSLSLTAGQSLVNSGVVQAANNLNLISNSIINSNLISSTAGNINISANNIGNISVNNTNGTLQALLINVRDSLFNAKSNFTLNGGDVISNALNIHSGTGLVRINVNDLTGVLNLNAGEVHVSAKTDNLNLGALNIIGDPTFYNQSGNIDFTNSFVFSGESLAIVAKGDITSTGDNLAIDTSSSIGNGGDITIVAGANFVLTNPGASAPFPAEASSGATLTITGGSSTGGKIDFNIGLNEDVDLISSASTFVGGAGGDIKLIAFKGTSLNSGSINLPNSGSNILTINTTGGVGGGNGDLLIIANGTSKTSNSISIGGINTNGTGSLTNTGKVEIYGAVPVVGSGVSIIDGSIIGGAFSPGKSSKSGILVNSPSDVGDTFTVRTDGTAEFANITVANDLMLTAGSGLQGTVLGDNVALNAIGGNISMNYAVRAGGTMTANTSGAGSISLTNLSGTASFIGASSAPTGKFELQSTNSIETKGTITSPRLLLHTSSPTADIILGANLGKTGATVDISTSGTGTITQTAGSIIGTKLDLSSGTGDIGSVATPINSSVSSVSATTGGAVVSIKNSGTLTVNASASGGLFKLDNTGSITVAKDGGILSPKVELTTPKNVVISAQVGSANVPGNDIDINAAAISQTAGTFRIIGGDVSLSINSANGSIGSSAIPIRTTALGLGMLSSVSAYASNLGNLNVLNSVAFNGTYKLVNDGNVSVVELLQNGPVIDIQTLNNGNILVASRLGGAASGIVNLTADGSGTISTFDPPGPIPGVVEGLTVTLKTGTGDIGTKSTPFETSAVNLLVGTTADAIINWAPNVSAVSTLFGYALSLKTSNVKDLTIAANGPVIIAGAVNAQNVSIRTFNDGVLLPDLTRDISIKANIGTSNVGKIELTSSNTGNGTSFSSADIIRSAGTIFSSTVNLASENENIGTSRSPILTASKLLAATTAGSGNIFISNKGSLSLGNIATPGGTFSLVTTGTTIDPGVITVDEPVTSMNDLFLQTKSNNANIILNGDPLTASGSITLNAHGTGSISDVSGASILTASNNINLISGKGDLGSSGSRLQIGGGTVFAKTSGVGNVFLNFQNSASIGTSAAGAAFDITTNGNASNVTIAGSVSSPAIKIVADANIIASANIKQTLNGKVSVNLSSTTGSIGSSSFPVLTVAKTLSVNTLNGSAFLKNNGALTLTSSSTNNVADDSLLSIQNIGTTIIAASLESDGTVSIASTSTISQTNQSSGFAIKAPTVVLSSNVLPNATTSASFGSATNRIQVDTENLTATTKGAVFVNNIGSKGNVNVNAFSGVGYDLTITNGNVTINGALSSPLVSISAKGDVTVAADTGKFGGKASISGANLIRTNSARVIGTTVTLAATGNGDIGAVSVGNDFFVDAANLIVKQNGGNSYITDKTAGPMNLAQVPASSSSEFVLNNDGNIVVKTQLLASTSITLNSGSGAISTPSTGLLKSSVLKLGGVAQTGNLGTATVPIKINASVVSANTDGGSVNLLNSGSGSLSVIGSHSGQSFKISDNTGSLSIDGAVTVGLPGDLPKKTNNLNLVQTGVAGAIDVNADLNVTGGSILINATDLGGKIAFATGVNVDTLVDMATPVTNGTIKVVVGKVPLAGTNPITSSGNFLINNTAPGVVFGGINPGALNANGAKVLPISLNAKGRNIIFNAATAAAIQFGDDVTITADPPGAGALTEATQNFQGALLSGTEARSFLGSLRSDTTTPNLQGSLRSDTAAPNFQGSLRSDTAAPNFQGLLRSDTAAPNMQGSLRSDTAAPNFQGLLRSDTTALNLQGSLRADNAAPNFQDSFRADTAAPNFCGSKLTISSSKSLSGSVSIFNNENTLRESAMDYKFPPAAINGENIQLCIGDSVVPIPISANKMRQIPALVHHRPVGARENALEFNLESGEVIFAPSRNLTVFTPVGELKIKAGAAVLVVLKNGGILSVFNLHDGGNGDVSIRVAGRAIFLDPGKHATVARGRIAEFSEVNLLDRISHRSVRSISNRELTVFSSEFSISSALSGLSAFAELCNSTEQTHKNIAKRIMKNAAILLQVGGKNGPYQRVTKDKSNFTAML